ncbi:MAG: glycogen debranching enzyme family protein [Ferruginibacter sp.]|nr:glycogen debranching enzyme family protein [Ferruginibacter sp.]
MFKINKSALQRFEDAAALEWLETNGLGGWSSSSVTGCNTRRYHGLLVAASVPPAERMVLVSKLDETILSGNQRFELGVNDYGGVIHPTGFTYLQSFTKDIFPQWIYEVNGIRIRKTIAMIQGENTTVLIYDVLKAKNAFSLELLPLYAVRGYHSLLHANDHINRDAVFTDHILKTKSYEGSPDIYIKAPGADHQANPDWFYHLNYAIEKYRGQDFEEDLFSYGCLSVQLKKGDSLGIIISTEDPAGKEAHELLAKESLRRQSLLNNQPGDKAIQQLALAADQFIVKRGDDLKTIIAGYHWFTDWGRDTMISLPGLCLCTGRYSDAKKILAAFAESVSEGMLPNRFQDNGEAPEYNNVDGTLWYFIAVHKYLQATNDKKFVLARILPVLKDIIHWHYNGTRYHIHVDDDELLYSGEAGVQLTWMDAKVGDWVVTPRTGKAVEIQALWYNALRIFAALLELNKEKAAAVTMNGKAEQVKTSFLNKFWNAADGYLYDVVDGDHKDASLRPNQLFAVSLPFTLLEGNQARSVLKIVEQKLYTPVGLRTLPADDNRYVGVYGGDQLKRDSSYHQGTAWSWLLGAYVDSIIRTEGKKSKAKKVIQKFSHHLEEGCIGSVAEIFDADAPHHPRGCMAQAWGVAEILRVITEYQLSSAAARAASRVS